MLKELHQYVPNQTPVYADDMNTLGQAVRLLNNLSGPDVFVDETGVHFRSSPAPALPEEDLGELDGQVHQMTSQLTSGWADLRLVNRA
jgi:hypothetical protein